jgi:hypothetical protein
LPLHFLLPLLAQVDEVLDAGAQYPGIKRFGVKLACPFFSFFSFPYFLTILFLTHLFPLPGKFRFPLFLFHLFLTPILGSGKLFVLVVLLSDLNSNFSWIRNIFGK